MRALLILNEWLPLLSITPTKLTINGDAPQTLAVRNTSKRAWNVQIIPAPWLTVTPAELSLEPEQERTVEIKRAGNPQPGAVSDPRAIVIVAPGREFEVEVALMDSGVSLSVPHPGAPSDSSPSPNSERGLGGEVNLKGTAP